MCSNELVHNPGHAQRDQWPKVTLKDPVFGDQWTKVTNKKPVFHDQWSKVTIKEQPFHDQWTKVNNKENFHDFRALHPTTLHFETTKGSQWPSQLG